MLENGKGHIVTVASVLGLAGSAQMSERCLRQFRLGIGVAETPFCDSRLLRFQGRIDHHA